MFALPPAPSYSAREWSLGILAGISATAYGAVLHIKYIEQPVATITNSVLNSPCFAWHPYGKLELFKTELVIEFDTNYIVCVDIIDILTSNPKLSVHFVYQVRFSKWILLIIHVIYPFLGCYHVAKLYWKCYIASFWPLVQSILVFISIVSWKCTCEHVINKTTHFGFAQGPKSCCLPTI